MPIQFHEKNKIFHLYNDKVSYIFRVLRNGQLGQLYFGKCLADTEEFGHLFLPATRDMSAYVYEGDSTFSVENIRQEYPDFGHGDMRYSAYEVHRENGSNIVEFVYKTHHIFCGKRKLEGLPSTYAEREEEATTVEVVLEDAKIHTKIILSYTIFEAYAAIAKSVRFVCEDSQGITLCHAMSGCMDLPDKDFVMVDLAGAWARERSVRERPIDYGTQGIHSMRGCSSYQFNPFLALKRKETTEQQGEVYGFSLIYSGNFIGQVEVDNYDVTRVLMGIHPEGFEWKLMAGESFQTPEMMLVYADAGINEMSQTFHELYRTRLIRGVWRDKERPILLNNWEVTYFDFDEAQIVELAAKGKEIGMELFVLDDGWFGKRDDSTSSLGDWYCNTRKLPNGLTGLADKINTLGMQFGIWIEPEMVSKNSDLFRAHPDWVLGEIGYNLCHSRNQYILDFSKEEVRDYIYKMLEKIFCTAAISYVKWDMNRTFSEVFSNGRGKECQGKVSHQYMLGVYELYERLIQKFPHILFESCASGGARFDPGMLYYAPLGWISDNTDAVDRLKIQYGTSLVYPICSMGSHVSPSPNNQNGRVTPIETRANVAYFGTLGYELNLHTMERAELDQVKMQVRFMKQYRKLIQQGVFYRLRSPFEGNETGWMVVSEEGKEALVGYYRELQLISTGFRYLKLQGLQPKSRYHISGYEGSYYGDELMHIGLEVSGFASGNREACKSPEGDFMSKIFHLELEE